MKHLTTIILLLIIVTHFGLSWANSDFNVESLKALGRTVIKPRIIKGDEVVPHSIPYQVGLHLKVYGLEDRTFCGGSLLSRVFVLTAAHCIYNVYEAEVILGAHNIFKSERTQQRFISKVFVVHRGWNSFTLSDDIGIVRLPRPANFTYAIQPIRLPNPEDEDSSFAFETARISGWGITADGSSVISPALRQMESRVTLPLICKLFFFGRTGPNQICVDGFHGRSTCSGDSGGPLIIKNKNGEEVQQGIVSFGIGFGCEKRWPQVFTKVSKYLKWIWEHTGIGVVP